MRSGAEDKPGTKSITRLANRHQKKVLKETKTPEWGVAIVSRVKGEWVAKYGIDSRSGRQETGDR